MGSEMCIRDSSMFLRLARQASTAEEKVLVAEKAVLNFPDPVYGGQLQDLAVPGMPGEGRMVISYEEMPVTLGDGTVVSLRKPSYSVEALSDGPLGADTTLSPRVTPQMIGLGLVEQRTDRRVLADTLGCNGGGGRHQRAVGPIHVGHPRRVRRTVVGAAPRRLRRQVQVALPHGIAVGVAAALEVFTVLPHRHRGRPPGVDLRILADRVAGSTPPTSRCG